MVIEHDHVATLSLEPLDAVEGSGAAVDRQQELSAMFLEAILDCGLAQAVTFFESMREIAFDFAAKDREDFDQDGGGADAIDVVITEDDDGLGVATRLEQAFHGTLHTWNEEGIGEMLEARVEEAVDFFGLGQSAIEKAPSEQRGNIEVLRQLRGGGGVGVRT